MSSETLSVGQMRLVDARAVSSEIPVYLMMENAGNALARYMEQALGNLNKKKVVVICGLANNGGGGFSSARHLSYFGANVTVILLGKPSAIRTKDAKLQWKTIEKANAISKLTADSKKELQDIRKVIVGADGIIDAILGTGYSGEKIREPAASAIDLINASRAYVISNDVPSGIDADTGAVKHKAVSPDITVVLHRKKTGLRKCGHVAVVSIGIPPQRKEYEGMVRIEFVLAAYAICQEICSLCDTAARWLGTGEHEVHTRANAKLLVGFFLSVVNVRSLRPLYRFFKSPQILCGLCVEWIAESVEAL